jgi:hypothetical protein
MTQSKDRVQGKRLDWGTSPKIGKLRRKSKLVVVKEIPTDLIQEKALELLGVVIIDREDYDDLVVPHGDIRFWVHRFDELIGTVSTWVIGEINTYHPKDYGNPKAYNRCDSLFGAVCQLLPKQELEIAINDAEFILRQRFATTPDYI